MSFQRHDADLLVDADPVVLTKESQLPHGRVVSGAGGSIELSEQERRDFVVIVSDQPYLLVAKGQARPAAVFKISLLIAKKLQHKPVIMDASSELIGLVYSGLNAAVPGADDRTLLEAKLHKILSDAIAKGASDIHFESRVKTANILFRINGLRQHYTTLSHEDCESLANLMYTHCEAGSKAASWNPSARGDGAFPWTLDDGRNFTFRFSSGPIHPTGGFKVVTRILSMAAIGLEMMDLGYSDQHLDDIETMTSNSSGMMAICGATNSGKSTSMQASLKGVYLRRGDSILIQTVEEPVEYVIPGACQTPVTRKRMPDGRLDNSGFIDAIIGALRQDPDILMVGEIRDNESAAVCKDFVLAGRFLATTLHTFSFMGAFKRLREIDIPWDVITMDGFWAGIIYQRLVPVLCPECSIPWSKKPENLSRLLVQRVEAAVCLNDLSGVRLRGKGCKACGNSSVISRTICSETWRPSPGFMHLLSKDQEREAYELWIAEGGIPAIQHAISKMIKGLVCPRDIESSFELLPARREMSQGAAA